MYYLVSRYEPIFRLPPAAPSVTASLMDVPTALVSLRAAVNSSLTGRQDRQLATEMMEILRLINSAESEHFKLNTEKAKLQARILELEQQVSALQSAKPQKQENKTEVVPQLDKVCAKIIKLLVESYPEPIPIEDVADGLGITAIKIDHLLKDLARAKLIYTQRGGINPDIVFLSDEGRDYAFAHGLAT